MSAALQVLGLVVLSLGTVVLACIARRELARAWTEWTAWRFQRWLRKERRP